MSKTNVELSMGELGTIRSTLRRQWLKIKKHHDTHPFEPEPGKRNANEVKLESLTELQDKIDVAIKRARKGGDVHTGTSSGAVRESQGGREVERVGGDK